MHLNSSGPTHTILFGGFVLQIGEVQSSPAHPGGHLQKFSNWQKPLFSQTLVHTAVTLRMAWLFWSTKYSKETFDNEVSGATATSIKPLNLLVFLSGL